MGLPGPQQALKSSMHQNQLVQIAYLANGLQTPQLGVSLLDADSRQSLHKITASQNAHLHRQVDSTFMNVRHHMRHVYRELLLHILEVLEFATNCPRSASSLWQVHESKKVERKVVINKERKCGRNKKRP